MPQPPVEDLYVHLLRRQNSSLLAISLACSLLCLSSCSGVTQKGEGPSKVNNLVNRIERVYVESELAREKADIAISALQGISASDFRGDPATQFAEYVNLVDESEVQAKRLREALEPMKDAAEPVFERWQEDQASISSKSLQQRSATRLKEARERYETMLRAVDPAMEAITKLNQGMRDLALFLGNDLNPSALQSVQPDVRELLKLASGIEKDIAAYLTASRDYMDRSALPSSDLPHAKPMRGGGSSEFMEGKKQDK